MIKEEAYNKMVEGYMITHKLFSPKEYLYMDEQFIIRNSNGETFENDWDVLNNPEWATDWYIYTGKHNKNLPPIIKKQKIDISKLPMIESIDVVDNDQLLLEDNNVDKNNLKTYSFEEKDKWLSKLKEQSLIEHKRITEEYKRNIKRTSNIIYILYGVALCIIKCTIESVLFMTLLPDVKFKLYAILLDWILSGICIISIILLNLRRK